MATIRIWSSQSTFNSFFSTCCFSDLERQHTPVHAGARDTAAATSWRSRAIRASTSNSKAKAKAATLSLVGVGFVKHVRAFRLAFGKLHAWYSVRLAPATIARHRCTAYESLSLKAGASHALGRGIPKGSRRKQIDFGSEYTSLTTLNRLINADVRRGKRGRWRSS
jgi:hypothetical protein